MGAFEAFRASLVTIRIQYSIFLVFSWECLEISASLSISWTIPSHMVLVSSCHSLSLAHFPLGFHIVFFSWFDTFFRFVVTFYLMFWDVLIDHAHFFTFLTCHGLGTSFFGRFAYFYFQPDIFITKRWKTCFHIHTIFERFTFIILSFFFMELGLKVNQGYFVIDGVSISW